MKRSFIFAAMSLACLSASALAGEFYVTGSGGAYQSSDFGGNYFSVEADPGWSAHLAVGKSGVFTPDTSVELELTYRNNGFQGLIDLPCEPEGPLSGRDTTIGALLNLKHGMRVADTVRLTGVAGLGYGARRLSFEPVPDNMYYNGMGADEMGFLWQVGAGVEWAVSESMTLGLNYRYFNSLNIDRAMQYGKSEDFFESPGDQHGIMLSLSTPL